MKLSKKIILTLLVAVILVSGVVVSAFAADPVDTDNIEAILEFYTGRNFLAEDYNSFEENENYTFYPLDTTLTCPTCGARLVGTLTNRGKTCSYACPNNLASPSTCTYKTKTNAKDVIPNFKLPMYIGFGEGGAKGVYKEVVKDGEADVLRVTNQQSDNIGYEITFDSESNALVITYRIKTDNDEFYDSKVNTNSIPPESGQTEPSELNNASKTYIYVKAYDPKLGSTYDIPVFQMDLSASASNADSRTISAVVCDPEGVTPDTKYTLVPMKDPANTANNYVPQTNTWYTVTAIVNFNTGLYNVDITPDGGSTISTGNTSLGDLEYASGAGFVIADGVKAGTKTWLDDLYIYEGTMVRHGIDKESYVSARIIELDELLKDSSTSADLKIRIVDLFDAMFNDDNGSPLYQTTEATPNKEAVDKIIAEATTTTINKVYADVYTDFVDALSTIDGYYAKLEHCETNIERLDVIFSDALNDSTLEDDDIAEMFPGVEDVAELRAAKAEYTRVLSELALAAIHSEAYLEFIKDFDTTSRDYTYMKDTLDALSVFNKRVSDYKYEIIGQIPNPDGDGTVEVVIFSTVADGDVIYTALDAKIKSIDAAVKAFTDAVAVMNGAANFGELYEGYVAATAAYNKEGDGIISSVLDNSTYPGLSDVITNYSERIDDMESRIAQSEAFITLVNGANSSTFYTTIYNELNKAEKYIDTDTADLYAEPDYPGVAEAMATYNSLRAKLADDVKNAEKYIAAVNAIEGVTAYAAKKAAVDAALALKEKGNVIGLDGILEANNALSVAEGEIKVLEGYSKTLIDAVNALDGVTSLVKRRELIAAANAARDNAEPSISGVNEAKTKLDAYIAAYNADVEALNSAFSGAVAGGAAVSAALVPSSGVYANADILKAAND